MVGVVEGGGGEEDEEGVGVGVVEEEEEDDVAGLGADVEGRKEMDRVPEKRTTETVRAMGRIAVSGFG